MKYSHWLYPDYNMNLHSKKTVQSTERPRILEISDQAFFSAFAAVFLAMRAGRNLPKLPIVIFPRLVLLSPLPMIAILFKVQK